MAGRLAEKATGVMVSPVEIREGSGDGEELRGERFTIS
jgi:hypothetical protein